MLSLQKIITLVDARKLSEPKYTEHDTFNQQIDIADIVVGNKTDLYATGDDELLSDYVSQRANKEGTPVVYTIQGDIHLALLDGETASVAQQSHHHHHHHTSKPLASELPIPPCGYIKAVNSGEGFESVGWRFAPNKVFSRQKLIELLVTIEAERLKAVFITQDGSLVTT
ncbi:putative metal chaperone [Vibrio astriarenae]|nr:putative metal chaperone [Vibrio sp. C7]